MPLELDTLSPVLHRFGVPRDGALIVHSAFKALSRQGYRVDGVVEALLECVRDGNVFMPTMTWRTVTPQRPNWDEISTPSHTGVLSEIFRTRYAVARSIHPTHSVAGWGPNAVRILSRHQFDTTPVFANSPYGLMRDFETYILLLGVGFESCTAIHLAEETINPALYLLPEESAELYDCRDRNGIVHKVRTRRHRRLDRDFPRFAITLSNQGKLVTGTIGTCPYTLVALRHLLREVFAALIQDPLATLRKLEP
jgi:aminoglycoside 3-N-acetyltransferase